MITWNQLFHLFISPVFKKDSPSIDVNNPFETDLFWQVDVQFTDRAGWNDINIPSVDSNNLFDSLEVQKDVLNINNNYDDNDCDDDCDYDDDDSSDFDDDENYQNSL